MLVTSYSVYRNDFFFFKSYPSFAAYTAAFKGVFMPVFDQVAMSYQLRFTANKYSLSGISSVY